MKTSTPNNDIFGDQLHGRLIAYGDNRFRDYLADVPTVQPTNKRVDRRAVAPQSDLSAAEQAKAKQFKHKLLPLAAKRPMLKPLKVKF